MPSPDPRHLIFRNREGKATARAVAGLIPDLEAEFPGAWLELHENPMPGADEPVTDLGVERERVRVVNWASWDEEREHIRRTCPQSFAALEMVEQAPAVRGKTHAEFMEESYTTEAEDRWQRQAETFKRQQDEERTAEWHLTEKRRQAARDADFHREELARLKAAAPGTYSEDWLRAQMAFHKKVARSSSKVAEGRR